MNEGTHILVVDDELETREAVQEYLRRRGFRVSVAGNEEEMHAILEINPANLVLLDLSIPGADTIRLTRSLKSSSGVGIIIVTSHGESEDRVPGLESGADDYIVKPLSFRELLARVNSVLRRISSTSSKATSDSPEIRVQIGDLIFDRVKRSLIKSDGSQIDLSSGELDLLTLFVENANRPLSRDELMKKSLHRDWGPLDRTIDVNVARLRRKIEIDSARPMFIKTVRGIGYVLTTKSRTPDTATSAGTVDVVTQEEPKPEFPEKPSIAVLPFTNMSGDKDQEHFSDGITEDIITELSRYSEIIVIARHSTFVYKNESAGVQDVAKDLGVRYVLEGSVRKVGNRVRITAQLIDASTEHHIWAERYDRDLDDIFAIQDEITRTIVVALQVKLTTGQVVEQWAGGTRNREAWEYMVSGRELYFRFTAEDNITARGLFEKALEVDPNYLIARIFYGWTHWSDAHFAQSADPQLSLALAEGQVAKVRATDQGRNMGGTLVASIHFQKGEYEEAVQAARSAMDCSPGPGDRAQLGLILVYAGEAAEAITELNLAIRLSPYHPSWYLMALAMAHLWNGDESKAIEFGERYLRRSTKGPLDYANLAVIYAIAGRNIEAERTVTSLLATYPSFRLGEYAKTQLYKGPQRKELVLQSLREAGLPD